MNLDFLMLLVSSCGVSLFGMTSITVCLIYGKELTFGRFIRNFIFAPLWLLVGIYCLFIRGLGNLLHPMPENSDHNSHQ